MTTQLHDEGEEFIQKVIFENDTYSLPSNVRVGLFHDGEISGDTTNGDDLTDAATPSNITTEPGGAGYSKWTLSLASSAFTAQTDGSTNWYASNDNSHDFDLSDSSNVIDAWFMEADVDLDNDSTAETVLLCTGNLSTSYDLSQSGNDKLTLQSDGVGFSLD